ncbi:glycosyltransferase [Saccharothrix violaceirubra]|uniref:O-mycaminosyltylonolide 6-deoxyallosyltransferase n=1 Tax=Saccharothrix violaceirubra TaxID=413306 RepID=A0A7W7T4W0_9PSEU|nr:nucleotide disphospho-sugar-binding domain-containing protein [Saccharothrix violaceirubra]MBB4966644.1 O-mycaminosyltylonolide 6-deoxyallosyltransferase [Saccharothrix violaceirubra]
MGPASAAVSRIGLAAIGSRGDVEPLLVLGAALHDRGHDVLFASSENMRDAAEKAGLRFHPITPATPDDVLADPEFRALLRRTTSPGRIARAMPRPTVEQRRSTLAELVAATADLDVVVHTPHTRAAVWAGPAPARWCTAALWPVTPTKSAPAFGFPALGPFNRTTYRLVAAGEWRFFREAVAAVRADAGLPPLSRPPGPPVGHHVLHPFSRAVFPVPGDWPDTVHVTGHWFGPGTGPDPDLAAFVAGGTPPVVATFGSTWVVDPDRALEAALAATRRARRRLVVVGGPETSLPDEVLRVTDADFGWLFPRAAAVVHHGGQGTTAAALRAGVPQVVVPGFADQPYWSRRIAGLGVAAAPIPLPELTADRLGTAVAQVVSDPGFRTRAEALAGAVRAEPGVEAACRVVEGLS